MTKLDIKQSIDDLWVEFERAKIVSSLQRDNLLLEQITILLFCRLLDEIESKNEENSKAKGASNRFIFFAKDQQNVRWKNLKLLEADELYLLVRDKVFPFLRSLADPNTIKSKALQEAIINNFLIIPKSIHSFIPLLKGVTFSINDPLCLSSIIKCLNQVPFDDLELKTFFYEYLLFQLDKDKDLLSSRFDDNPAAPHYSWPDRSLLNIVDLIAPKKDENILDPACGTGDFLAASLKYIRKKTIIVPHLTGLGLDISSLRIASVKMIMHDVNEHCIFNQNPLAEEFKESFADVLNECYDIVITDLFKYDSRAIRNNRQTATHFLAKTLKFLKDGGRCAIIVPESFLFETTEEKFFPQLLDNNKVEAIISLPSIPIPYSSLGDEYNRVAVLYTKGGQSSEVLFYKLKKTYYCYNGSKLEEEDESTFIELLDNWKQHKAGILNGTDRKSTNFYVSAEEIRANNYDLRIKQYEERT